MPQAFSVHSGHSPRLIRARRLFIESYLLRHDFAQVHGAADRDDSVVYSMTTNGRTYWLRVSDAWLVSPTHLRVDERLEQLQVLRMLHDHGAVYVDLTSTGVEVLTRC